MVEPIKVVIACREGPFRTGLENILGAEHDIEILGITSTGIETIEKLIELSPHVILMDFPSSHSAAFEAVAQIRGRVTANTILLTDSEWDEDPSWALARGFRGYLLSSSSNEEIVKAVRKVAAGGIVLSPGIATKLITRLVRKEDESKLSEREMAVFNLLGEELSNMEIADSLGVSVSTVRTYVYRILDKLKLRSRKEAVAYSRRLALSYVRIAEGLNTPAVEWSYDVEQKSTESKDSPENRR